MKRRLFNLLAELSLQIRRFPDDHLTPIEQLIVTPGYVMGVGGWFCCTVIPFANDSPQTKVNALFYAALLAVALTGPIGLVTLKVSTAKFRRWGGRWLWLN